MGRPLSMKATAPFVKRGLPNKLQRHRLVDEHDRNAVPNQIGTFSVLTNQKGFECGPDFFALEVFESPLAGLFLKTADRGVICQPNGLESLWATEDREEFRIDRGGGAHRVRPRKSYFFFLRRGRPVRSFSVTS